MELSTLRKKVGNRLRNVRVEHGYTQFELAEKINCSSDTISRIERGINSMSDEILLKVANFFNVEVSYFFLFKETEISTKKEDLLVLLQSELKNFKYSDLEKLHKTIQIYKV